MRTSSAPKKPPFKKHPLTIAIQACCYTILGGSPLAVAAPTGGAVVGGSGTIAQSGTATTINQATQNLAINWQSFDVAANERVQFIQPNSSAIALNRILSNNGSTIAGRIDSNGRVILVNANGVFFTSTAVLNVGSIIASGLDINPAAFMNGNYIFNEIPGSSGAVINNGMINASLGGNVALIGKHVENNGLIVANLGTVTLAAGKQAVLTFDNGGLLGVRVSQEILQSELGVDPAVLNSGTITAQGGRVLLTASQSQDVFSRAVNTTGMEPATSVVVNDDGTFTLGNGADVLNSGTINTSSTGANQNGGRIVLLGNNVTSSGTLRADAQSGNGGEIELHSTDMTLLTQNSLTSARSESNGKGGIVKVLGDKVGLFDQSTVDVSGANGGGQALIGGDFQGKNPLIRNASRTIVAPGSTIYADAINQGNGGKVIVWSDDYTRYYGNIFARGGSTGGNGGFAEVSGKEGLVFEGQANLTAAYGSMGTLLLDPKNITICDATTCSTSHDFTGVVIDYDSFTDIPSTSTTLRNTDLANALTNANVLLRANNDITVAANVTSAQTTSGSSLLVNNLTLEAGRSIAINAGVTIALDNANFSATINHGSAQSGDRDSGNAVFSMGTGSSIVTRGGNITILADDHDNRIGNFTLQTLNSSGRNAAISTGGSGTNAGDITVTNAYGDIAVNGQITALGGAGASSTTVGGNGGNAGAGGNIALEATRGSIIVGAAILSSGGAGAAGSDGDPAALPVAIAGGAGGTGGNAGTIDLKVGKDLTVNANIVATGGTGGAGGGDGAGNPSVAPIVNGVANIITLNGSGAANVFTINEATLAGFRVEVWGQGGIDRLVRGGTLNNTWIVTSADTGTLAFLGSSTVNFYDMASLIGSAVQDTFTINAGGSLSGLLNGGGGASDRLTVNNTAGTTIQLGLLSDALAVGDLNLNVTGIEFITVAGTAASNTVLGENIATTWTISGANTGTIAPTTGATGENSVSFGNIGTLTGGNQTDTFNVTGGTIGTLNGGAGVVTDIFNVTGGTATTMNGGAGDDTFTVVAAASGAATTMNGDDGNDSFTVTATGGGGSITMNGDAGNDTFVVTGEIIGAVNGGAGTNILTFSGTADDDAITLGAGTLLLSNSSGDFNLTYSGLNDISIDTLLAGTDSVALSNVSLAGNLRLANTETVTGTSTALTANTLILDNVGQFGTAGALIGTTIDTLNLIGPASQIYIKESSGLDVNMAAAGVNSASVFQVGGLTRIDAGGSALALNAATNDFDTVNIINAASITLRDQNAIAGGTMNAGTGSITLNTATGIGTVSALNTTTANLTVTNTTGDVSITNSGPVSASVITAGNINFSNTGTLTIRQLNANGGRQNSGDASYGGTINLTVTDGAVNGTNYVFGAQPPIPDIVAGTFIGRIQGNAGGDFGAAGMFVNVMVKDRFELSAIGRRAFIQFIPARPPITIIDATLTLSVDSVGGINTQLLEVDSLDEFDPAIFTEIRNYYYEDVAIMMPADQRLDATDEEEKDEGKEGKL